MRKGFSLVELLIAMTMSGMIFVAVSSLLVTLLTTNTKDKRQEVFEQTKNDLFVEFSNGVRWGDVIVSTDHELVVDGKTYHVQSGTLTKNGDPITPASVEITNFQITPRSARAGLASFEITIAMRDRGFSLNTNTLSVVVSQRKTEGEAL